MKKTSSPLAKKLSLCLIPALSWVLLTPTSHAATIAWWRGNLDSSDISNPTYYTDNILVDSVGNHNAVGTKGTASNDVSGAYIFDPVSGQYYTNTLAYQGNPAIGTAKNILNSSSLQSILQNNFTIEAIVKMNSGKDAGQSFFNQYSGSQGGIFSLGLGGWDYQTPPAITKAVQTFYGSSAGALSLQYVNGTTLQPYDEYYSLAITGYLDGNNDMQVSLFLNGIVVGSATYTDGFYFTSDPFSVSGNWQGMIDEMRISDIDLTPDQFLQFTAVPEPNTGALLLGGLGLVLVLRKLRSQKLTA